jgi:hypothetical protein
MRPSVPLLDALDAALEMTFPASDPIAVYRPEPARPDNRDKLARPPERRRANL